VRGAPNEAVQITRLDAANGMIPRFESLLGGVMRKSRSDGPKSKKLLTEDFQVNREIVDLPAPLLAYTWVTALDGKLEDHGKIAEAGLPDEYAKWIRKFKEMLKNAPVRVQAWNNLEPKLSLNESSDFLFSLYLFTSSDKTAAQAIRDRFRLLKKKLDSLISTHSKVRQRTVNLLKERRLATATLSSADLYLKLVEALDFITTAKQKLHEVRRLASAGGSGRIYSQGAALYRLANIVEKN
jgi:hypothetical protein